MNKENINIDKKKLEEQKKQNKEKRKQYRKQLNSEMFEVDNEFDYNEKGEVSLECKIGKAENIFNKYDLAKQRTITDEFEKYLMEEVEIIPMSENIAIKMFVDDEFSTENEKQVKKAMKNHFGFKITTDKVKMRSNNRWALVFFILGLTCLILSPFFNRWFQNSGFPFYETILVLTWFFLWEAFGMAFFDRTDLKEHQYNLLRLYNADISFVKIPTNTKANATKEENKNNTQNFNLDTNNNTEKSPAKTNAKSVEKINLFSLLMPFSRKKKRIKNNDSVKKQ